MRRFNAASERSIFGRRSDLADYLIGDSALIAPAGSWVISAGIFVAETSVTSNVNAADFGGKAGCDEATGFECLGHRRPFLT